MGQQGLRKNHMNNFGSYKEIKEHNIEFIRCDEITKPQELKEYNVVHPSPTIIEGLRGDAREDIVGEVDSTRSEVVDARARCSARTPCAFGEYT